MGTASMRQRFIDYATTELKHLQMFLAENAEKDYVTHDDPEFHNVAEFEDIIGGVSDCLIIFPESAGSFAELGYFCQSKQLRKRILVAHDAALQSSDSFILRGPVALIDDHSQFKPAVQISYANPDFSFIKLRIEKRITGKSRKPLKFEKYADVSPRERFFAVFELIRIFSVITLEGVEYAFKSVFGHASPSDIKHFLSILVAAERIERAGDHNQYFCYRFGSRPFMDFGSADIEALRLEVLDIYDTHFPEVSDIAKGLGK